jgi:ADP-heptose:LPS heptosyltransferase
VKDPDRILIYRCGAIGDTVVSIPAIHAIRSRYPRASFALMTASGGEGIVWTDHVLSEFGWFDGVITYEAKELTTPWALWAINRRIRALAPKMVIYLGSDYNSALKIARDRFFFRLAGVRRFVGTYSDKVSFCDGGRDSIGKRLIVCLRSWIAKVYRAMKSVLIFRSELRK